MRQTKDLKDSSNDVMLLDSSEDFFSDFYALSSACVAFTPMATSCNAKVLSSIELLYTIFILSADFSLSLSANSFIGRRL